MNITLCRFTEKDTERFDFIASAIFDLTHRLLNIEPEKLTLSRDARTGSAYIESEDITPRRIQQAGDFIFGVVQGLQYAYAHPGIFSGSQLKNEDLAQFKLEDFDHQDWEHTPVWTEKYFYDAHKASEYAHALSVINDGRKVRWNWKGSTQGHCVDASGYRQS